MSLRTYGNYDTDKVSEETALFCLDETMAQQNFKDDADINVIMRRFGQGHDVPQGFLSPTYGDFDTISDYREALEAVRDAGELFMELPADLRARFNNDPGALIDFVSADENRAEAEKLGLLQPRADSSILDVTVLGDTPVTAPPSPTSKGDSHETSAIK